MEKLQQTKVTYSTFEILGLPVALNSLFSDLAHSLFFFGSQLRFPPEMPCRRIRTYGSRYLVEVARFASLLALKNSEVVQHLVGIVSIRSQSERRVKLPAAFWL
jgi:hypothetical protein